MDSTIISLSSKTELRTILEDGSLSLEKINKFVARLSRLVKKSNQI